MEGKFERQIDYLRRTVQKSSARFLRRTFINDSKRYGLTGNYEDTLDAYYVSMINDTLRQIRKRNGVAYIFSLEQVAEILRFEPLTEFIWNEDSGSFTCFIPSAVRNNLELLTSA